MAHPKGPILPPPQTAHLPLPDGVLPDVGAAGLPDGVLPDSAGAGLPDGVLPDTSSVQTLVNPAGEVVGMPRESVDAAFQQGYRLATPEDIARHQREQEFGTFGQQIATGAEAAGSALTFGLSNALETGLGISTPEAIRARAETNPVSHAIGTGIGIAAPMVATLGADAPLAAGQVAAEAAPSLLRTAADFTAPNLISRVGRGAAGLLGEGAPRLAQIAAAGATEGALYAGSDVTEKALLGDPALTWEGAATELGAGALFGGALGAGTDLAARGLGKVLSKATEGLESVARLAAKGDPATVDLLFKAKGDIAELEKVAPGASDAIAASTPETAKFILDNRARIQKLEEEFPGLTDVLARATPDTGKQILDNWGKLLKDPQARIDLGNSLTEAVNTAYKGVETALRAVNTSIRPAETEALAQAVDPQKAQTAFVKLYSTVDALARKMRAEPDLFQPSAARELELIRDGMARDAQGMADQIAAGERTRAAKVVTPQMPDGEPVEYRVVEADQVEPSHSWSSFRPNERYPEGVQERNYLGQKGEQQKVEEGARNLNPSLLITDTPSALDGPPLVTDGPNQYVMGGNGRTMMLKRAIAEHPDRFDAYRKELIQRAPQFGIPSEEVARLKNPMLVRVAKDVPSTASKQDMIAAVRRFNEGMTQQFSPIARAIAQSKTLSQGAVESLAEILGMAGDKSLRDVLRDSPESILAVLRRDGIANAQNEARWMQGGQLTEQAKDEIEGMFLGRVFESEQRFSQTAPELTNKIERAAPSLIKVAGQTPQFDQIGTVRGAIDLLNGARQKNLKLDDYLFELTHQGTMLSDAPTSITKDAVRMAKLLDGSGQKAVQQRFKEWAEHLNPQGSLFGPKVKPTAESADKLLFAGLKVKEPKAGSIAAQAKEAVESGVKPHAVEVTPKPSFEPAAAAQQMRARAEKVEPTVTQDMMSLQNDKAKLVGLKNRLKEASGIERALKDHLAESPGLSHEQAAAKVGDALRYTLQVPASDYAAEVQRSIRDLEAKGYTVAKFKNFWGKVTKKLDAEGKIYQGINVNLKEPGGHVVELQFHTPESLAAKQITHKPYEEFRLRTTKPERQADLVREMAKVQDKVQVPAGATEITPSAAPPLHPSIKPGQVFTLLNRTKQLVDAQAKFGKLITPEWRRTADALKGLRSEFKRSLEDPATWGAAGERQAAFNRAQNAYFTARTAITNGPANQKLMQKLITRTGSVEYEANPRSVNSWINLMADGRGTAKSDSFASYLKAAKELADEMEISGYPRAGEIRQLVHDIAEQSNEIRQRGTITQLVKMLQGHEILSSGPAIPLGQQAMMAAAKRLPGGVGHLISLSGTVQKVRNPALAVNVLATLEKYAKKASAKLNAGADAIFKSGVGGAAAGEAAGVQKFSEGGMVRPEGFADVSGTLRNYSGNLDRLASQVSSETSLLQEHAPATADAAHAFAARLVSHLASKLPDPGERFLLDAPYEPSATELAEFNRHHEVAVKGPAAVLEHLAKGTLLPEHVETSMALYPRMHGEAQQLVMSKLAEHMAKEKSLPIRLRTPLSLFLGRELDYSQTPQAVLSAQQTFQAPQPPPPPSAARPLKTDGAARAATGSQGNEIRMARA